MPDVLSVTRPRGHFPDKRGSTDRQQQREDYETPAYLGGDRDVMLA